MGASGAVKNPPAATVSPSPEGKGSVAQDTRPVAPPGLKGLVVADTSIGAVRGEEGFYHYRQYPAPSVARARSFEATAHLLLEGHLPSVEEEAQFQSALGEARVLPAFLLPLIEEIAPRVSPLVGLRTLLPLLTGEVPSMDLSPQARRAEALRVVGATPALLAAFFRAQQGLPIVPASPDRSHAADYLAMLTGNVPTAEVGRAVGVYLALTADHGFNASTFTGRVVTSTGASVGGALASAIAALSGPLHGGAPSRVLDMLEAIGDPARTESYAREVLAEGGKVMGFGHAVYRAGDPRSALLREVALSMGGPLVERAFEVESRMLAFLAEWKPSATLVTNVEFYAAVVLHLAGVPQSMFTPTFATSRMVGWAAHVLEQAANNKIIRPSARYVGTAVMPSWVESAEA